jgi:hypothetical protein
MCKKETENTAHFILQCASLQEVRKPFMDKAPELQRLSVTVEVLRVGVMIVGVISVGVMNVGVLSVGVMTLSRFMFPYVLFHIHCISNKNAFSD